MLVQQILKNDHEIVVKNIQGWGFIFQRRRTIRVDVSKTLQNGIGIAVVLSVGYACPITGGVANSITEKRTISGLHTTAGYSLRPSGNA
jgi:hypothetical protein